MKAKNTNSTTSSVPAVFYPGQKNRIMFYANNRKGYVCNPSVLMESFWLKHPGEYELIWSPVFRKPVRCGPELQSCASEA